MAQSQHQHQQPEHELLFDTLSALWSHYLNATQPECRGDGVNNDNALEHDHAKKHWLQLFLYNFQFLDEQTAQQDDFKSFFNTIPEELCSYLLEQVYRIISASKLFSNELTNTDESTDTDGNLTKLNNKHNFAQLILSTPSDCSKIVALRTFLTNELGHHLLTFLLKVDMKLIASQKSLCQLCINLFPNCNWSDCVELLTCATNICDFINNFNINTRNAKTRKHQQQQQHGPHQPQSQQYNKQRQSQLSAYISKPIEDLESFINATKSSDEIALLLIQLLTKCVQAETNAVLGTQAISITVHNFALGYLCAANVPTNQTAKNNDEVIKFELLQLIAKCMNNFYASDENPNVLDVNSSLSQLLYALVANRDHTQLAYAVLQIMFTMLHNLIEMLSKRSQRNNYHAANGNNQLNIIDKQTFNACFDVLIELLERPKTAEINDEHTTQLIFTQIYKTLLRLTQNLARYEQNLSYLNDSNGGNSSQHKPPRRHKRANTRQLHCCIKAGQQQRSLACYFQRKIFTLLPNLSTELQEYSMRHLLRSGSCCCHYNLTNYATCLKLATQIGASYQKCTYKFLHQHILNTLFLRVGSTSNQIKSEAAQCTNCNEKLKSQIFHSELLKVYIAAYKSLPGDNGLTLLLFLKHLKHIAYLLAYDLAAGIIAEVVLPIFRQYKDQVMQPAAVSTSTTPTNQLPKLHLPLEYNKRIDALRTLHECLSIFVMYLSDIRLIKAFYNEENIKHMEDLLSIPELQRGVCDLIKVGIDNITFLGDNSHEQSALSRRLITLQLNSSDHAARLFHALVARCDKSSSNQGGKFWLDDANVNGNVPLSTGHKPLDVLYIAALQWTLNYELLKTSQLFYNEFAKIYSIVVEPDDDEEIKQEQSINGNVEGENTQLPTSSAFNLKRGDKTIIDILKLNYNALSCFLMLPGSVSNDGASTTATATTTPTKNNKSIDKGNVCQPSSLEALVSNFEMPAEFQLASIHNPMISSTLSTITTTSTYDDSSFDYTSITTNYAPDSFETTRFLNRLQNAHEDKSIVLFDIRNQEATALINYHQTTASVKPQLRFDNVTHNTQPTSTWVEATSTVQQQSNAAAAAAEGAGIIGKLFSIVGSLFSGSSSRNSTETLAPEIDSELRYLYEPNSECKKFLLKLFEATMAICIKGYQNEEVEKMQKHLRKLKAIIISNAETHWPEHAEHNTRENVVIQTLQTLLKIAELSHTLNEPAGIVHSSSMLTTATEDALTSSPPSSATRARARSFNSSIGGAGGVELPKLRMSTQLPAKNSIATPPTPRRPISGESGDADYFSTRASFVCADSELEFSENDNDYYLTADEGYEADGEIPEVTDSDSELTNNCNGTGGHGGDIWHSLQPTSRYRSHVMHDGLCRLVVEILIELSKQCIQNPVGWTDNLAQLANRMFVIRDYLGGSMFLLQGFAPVLSCNDVRLRELQQSVLELVTHLNSPDILSTYFSILATKNPPMDILIKYMQHVSVSSLKKAQPSSELEFPVTIDGKCITTAERHLTEHIDRMRSCHLTCQATTPFTRAPCIIPVTHTRIWHNDGCTLSLWLEIKKSQQNTQRNSMQLNDDEMRCSGEDTTKTHIASLGTNQAMLSLYVNNNMQLVLEMCKPNAEQPSASSRAATQASAVSVADISCENVDVHTTNPEATIATENLNGEHRSQQQQHTSENNNAYTNGRSPFQKALKQTKQVLINSFNQMHFLNGHHQSGSELDSCFEISNIQLKYIRLTKNKWTHLALAVDNQPERLDITIFIDGLEKHTISLPFRHFRVVTRTHSFQLLALGDSVPPRNGNQNLSSCNESRSTLDVSTPRLSIANLILFNRKIDTKDVIMNLTSLGPDFTEFTQCQVANWKPNYGYLNLAKMSSANFGNFGESMKVLRQARVLTYTAQQPDMVIGYDSSQELDNATYGRPYGLILYGELLQNELQSLQTSTILCGGLSTLIYLFAKVVEVSNNANTQALALDLLLSVAHSETQLFTEFQRNDYISLIGYVIKSERCTKDVQLLKSIINNACTQPLICKKGDTLQVNENTNSIVVYPRLIIAMLHRYSDWHRSGAKHSDVLDMLFRCILALTREKHPHRDFNMEQLQKVGIIKEMLSICKVYVIESPNPVFISKEAAEYFVQILSVFAGSPPAPSLLDEIMKLLLLLQKPSECYVLHDRAKFYFLLTPDLPIKERSTMASNLSRVTSSFRRSAPRRHPGAAVPVTDKNNVDIEIKRLARIQHLRKLHASNSTYKRSLFQFEEMLDRVADCTKLNKSALRLLSPNEATTWRKKYKRHIYLSPEAGTTNSGQTLSPQKIRHRRFRTSLVDSGAKCTKSTNQNAKHSLGSLGAGSLFDFENFAMCPKDGLCNASTPYQRRTRASVKTDFYSTEGIMALQEGLLTLLKDSLCLLPDRAVDDVLLHYVKLEFLLVLANHSSCAVRAAIIRLLDALTKRLPHAELATSYKNLYPLHLANQLSIFPSDAHMFEACIAWITGIYGNVMMISNCDNDLLIRQRFGLNSLLAIVTKTCTSQVEFTQRAFHILQRIFINNPDDHQTLIEAGLLQCCMKALYNLYAPPVNIINPMTEQAIISLLFSIGEKSLKSVGQINIIWDILNMLSFYQEKQSTVIVRSFRSVQAQLQLDWINMFFIKTNVPWSFKVTTFTDCTLSLSECKIRLDMLIDRCSQFFTIYETNYTPSDSELKLFEFLVSYGVSTNQRCNNFIAWGLLPSRPRDLRAYIVDALWITCQDDFQHAIICDGKMIKTLLWLSLYEDLEQPIENLPHLCKSLGISENDSNWNLEHELDRIELGRYNASTKQKLLLEKTIFKFESLAQVCVESSMEPTRRSVETQNAERKLLMSHMKDYDDTHTYTKWLEIIRRMTHEGAPWYCKERAESSWELDDTEGPSRVHTRLRRCHLDIDKRFFMEDYNNSDSKSHNPRSVDDFVRPLDYLISSYDQQLNISLNSQILYNFPAKFLPVDGEIDGEIIITDHKLYFLATYRCKYFNVNCDISNITEIWLKRYQHQEKAFEIFLDTNKSLFFSLQNQDDWKIIREVFCDKILTTPDSSTVQSFTQNWREGKLTNWEYLMTLNQIAGRTYNDLMQYPVFPWILSSYKTDTLDLTDAANFRKLEKPIAVQEPANEEHYINNYAYIQNTITNMGSMILKPYHYSSHYSNSGTVLHFLVRVPPFTSYFLRYQDNNFDWPDRTFHDLGTTWCLASRDSPTDVKELIPEFFCLPEMFENFERFDFGCRQNGERVEDVILPAWCQRDPRLFTLIHRQALESEYVRNNLHNWIDLIFGYKQTGESAVDAINVFHPATYAFVLDSEFSDPIERNAVETMVKTYGQMPLQLFRSPHATTKPLNNCLVDKQIMQCVRGLRWGVYVGSPQLPTPQLGNIHKLPGAEYLVSFNNTNVIYGLPAKSCVMQGAEADTYNVISWGYDDRIVRIQPLNKLYAKPKNLLHNTGFDDITACGCDANSNQLWFGHKSGRISVYKCTSVETQQRTSKGRQSYVRGLRQSYNSAVRKITTKGSAKTESDVDSESIINTSMHSITSAATSVSGINDAALHRDGADLSWCGPTVLVRHTDEITCISLCVEFKVAVTAGRDGIAVIWDLTDLSYVRTIVRPAEIHHSPITHVTISPTLGDIVTVHTLPWQSADGNEVDAAVKSQTAAAQSADECFEVTEENLDDFVNVNINPNGKSILRLHSVNARYVQHIVHEDRILAVCYSYIKEGVGVNVIATAVEGGIVRLWSSWNLSFVSEIVTGISNIKSICYSTHQHLVVLTRESRIQVWETEGLTGNSPKFPQIAYK